MVGRKTIAWPQDSTRVNVNDERELEFWTRRFHVSRGKLEQTVRAVGSRYKDVEWHLSNKR